MSSTPFKEEAAAAPTISPPRPTSSFPEGGFPYCQRAKSLLLELQRSPDWLPNYNEEGVRAVLEECALLEDMLTKLSLRLSPNGEDLKADRAINFSVQTLHLCISRNKRALLAYFNHRNAAIERVYWETSAVALPTSLAQRLSRQEVEYYNSFHTLVSGVMEKMDLDLLAHRVPPGANLLIQVRCLQDLGQVLLQSGATAFLAKHSVHFLRRDDVEHLIRQNLLQQI